jgi:hypothetical protein
MTKQKQAYCQILLLIFFSIFALNFSDIEAQEINLEHQLILFLPFQGDALDQSGINIPTSVEGPVLTADRFGNPENAYLFDGLDDCIRLNNNEALITSKSFTIAIWARMDGSSQALLKSNSLFEQRDHGKDVPVVIHFNADQEGQTRLTLRSKAEISTSKVEDNYPGYGTWHHFVALMDENKIMRLYIDGVLRDSDVFYNDGDFVSGVNEVSIGGHHPEELITGAFSGALDEVYIYNRAINPCEIEALFSGQLLNER